MNDQARQKLCDFISNYGPTICSTPRTCNMVLGQQCADFPTEKDLLLRALDRGAVTGVMKGPVGGPWDDLVKQVAGSSVSPDDARWAVESWAIALGKHPDAAPLPPEPVVSMNAPPDATKTSVTRAAGSTRVVAVGGAIGGGFTTAIIVMVLIILHVQTLLLPRGIPTIAAVLIICIGGVFGAFCGGGGAALGWVVVQTQSSALSYTTEEANRRMRKGFMGALTGALVGSVLPGYFAGPLGSVGGAFFGALAGAITGSMGGAAGGTSRNY
jgi:hypothetical protein